MHYYMLNKPTDHVTACSDASHKTVMDCFPEAMRGALHPVGRLDIDTTGLLLVTDDGGLDNRIMQPGRHVEKCYRFRALGDAAVKRLEEGIVLGRTGIVACRAAVEIEDRAKIRDVCGLMPEKYREKWMKNPNGGVVTAKITITEGRNHQVKRMLRAAGCLVFTLERLRIGGLTLDPTLAPGSWRELTRDEVNLVLPDYLDENGVPTMARNWRET